MDATALTRDPELPVGPVGGGRVGPVFGEMLAPAAPRPRRVGPVVAPALVGVRRPVPAPAHGQVAL